jgi:hypothetical protein
VTDNRESIRHHLADLESLARGERAIDELVRFGQEAVPFLAAYLLNGKPKSVAASRCRAASALGALGAYSTLAAYFRQYRRPEDSVLAFAEDAVRSAAAQELLHWKSLEAFQVLLAAAKQRATSGLVLALGEFCRPESVPVLFEILEDDICREQAKSSLLKTPDAAREYAILTIRGATSADISSPSSIRRKRATLQILKQIGISSADWPNLRRFLWDEDADVVIAAGQLGFMAADKCEREDIMIALFSAACEFNCFQEDEFSDLCDAHPKIAHNVALNIATQQLGRGILPNGSSPLWRTLKHILGDEMSRVSGVGTGDAFRS